nr:MAG TPA: hypothetical protein [Caudoviricetes sp.]
MGVFPAYHHGFSQCQKRHLLAVFCGFARFQSIAWRYQPDVARVVSEFSLLSHRLSRTLAVCISNVSALSMGAKGVVFSHSFSQIAQNGYTIALAVVWG